MKTEFVLHIDIANDATLGDANLSDILKKVAEEIAWVGIQDNRRFQIRDVYGNVVGHYGRYSSDEGPEDFGCGAKSPNGYICTDHNATEHLCRGITADSLADSWPLDEEGSCPDRIAFGSCDHDSCKEAD
jgi:hypothetical protein